MSEMLAGRMFFKIQIWRICMYIIFLKILHEGFNQYVPKKQIVDTRNPPWYNKRLIN